MNISKEPQCIILYHIAANFRSFTSPTDVSPVKQVIRSLRSESEGINLRAGKVLRYLHIFWFHEPQLRCGILHALLHEPERDNKNIPEGKV